MKTILLVRHAKSSWDDFSISDADRPLNDRGRRNAPKMAIRLLKKKISIDAFLSSPANRALTTARLFAAELGFPEDNIIVIPALYLADKAAFVNAISSAPREADTIAVFSHNSGITDFANSLTNVRIDNMPTCSVFAFTEDISDWKRFGTGPRSFLFFDYPKATPGESD